MNIPRVWINKDLPLTLKQVEGLETVLVETQFSAGRIDRVEAYLKNAIQENKLSGKSSFIRREISCPLTATDEAYDGHRALFITAAHCRNNRTIRMLFDYLIEDVFPNMDPSTFKGVYSIGAYDTWFTYPQLFLAFASLSRQSPQLVKQLNAHLPLWREELQSLWLKDDNYLMFFNGTGNIFDAAEPWLFLTNEIVHVDRVSPTLAKSLLHFAAVHELNHDASDLIAKRICNSFDDLSGLLASLHSNTLLDKSLTYRKGLRRIRDTILRAHVKKTIRQTKPAVGLSPIPSM